MYRRGLLTTIGATALAFGAVGGIAGVPGVIAQSTATTTPTTQAPDSGATATDASLPAAPDPAETYKGFVASIAKSLGKSDSEVDGAIRSALKQEVADQLAAGTITKEEAAARAAVIDVTDAPLGIGFGGRGHDGDMHGGPGEDGHGGPGGRGGKGGDMRGGHGSDMDDDHGDGKGDWGKADDDESEDRNGSEGASVAPSGELPADAAATPAL